MRFTTYRTESGAEYVLVVTPGDVGQRQYLARFKGLSVEINRVDSVWAYDPRRGAPIPYQAPVVGKPLAAVLVVDDRRRSAWVSTRVTAVEQMTTWRTRLVEAFANGQAEDLRGQQHRLVSRRV